MSALWRALRCFVSRFLGQVFGRVECLAWRVESFLWKGLWLLLNLCHFGWFWLFCWCLFGGTGYIFHSTPCPSATGFPLGPRRRQAAEQRNSWESSFEGKEMIFETTNQQDRYIYIYVSIYLSIYLSIYVSIYLCIYVSVYLCNYVSMYLCMYLCVCVCMYACMYVCMYERRMYVSMCLITCSIFYTFIRICMYM